LHSKKIDKAPNRRPIEVSGILNPENAVPKDRKPSKKKRQGLEKLEALAELFVTVKVGSEYASNPKPQAEAAEHLEAAYNILKREFLKGRF
jgi:hypothetical protein